MFARRCVVFAVLGRSASRCGFTFSAGAWNAPDFELLLGSSGLERRSFYLECRFWATNYFNFGAT